MNERERFLRCMHFEEVDRVPLMEMGVLPETFERWHKEGLPAHVTDLSSFEKHLGLDRSFNMNWLPIEGEIYPLFERLVLEETEEDEVIRDNVGVTFRQRKGSATIPHFISFPVGDERDYEELLPRLDGTNPQRYAPDFEQQLCGFLEGNEIVGLNFPGFYGFPRSLMGMENLAVAFHDKPNFVQRIIDDRLQFAKDLYARILQTGKLDFVQVWEDMAFKTASLISPKMVREFMLPAYKELVSLFRDGGVKLIMVDCDGHVNDILSIFLEAGMDGTHPCEIAASADPLELRARYPRAALMGGMDKRRIASGPEGTDAELKRIEPLVAKGGYIPFLDHFVPASVSYDAYRYYVDARRKLCASVGQ